MFYDRIHLPHSLLLFEDGRAFWGRAISGSLAPVRSSEPSVHDLCWHRPFCRCPAPRKNSSALPKPRRTRNNLIYPLNSNLSPIILWQRTLLIIHPQQDAIGEEMHRSCYTKSEPVTYVKSGFACLLFSWLMAENVDVVRLLRFARPFLSVTFLHPLGFCLPEIVA
jgi:hypothetical protein